LEWKIPVVDTGNRNGALEFNVHGRDANDFFPVVVSFVSPKSFAGVEVCSARLTVDWLGVERHGRRQRG
jgi:hypothetical protein